MTISRKDTVLIILSTLLLVVVSGVFYFDLNKPRTVDVLPQTVVKEEIKNDPHPLSGKRCENSTTRPFAVMLAEDTSTRPLSGIAKADLVVEMPVVKDSITRIMALYACEEPEAIGSVRSARDDFIPLAAGFDAIYAHWGGSSFALKELNKDILDNLDALINPNNVFYRKSGILAPDNGFTSYARLLETSIFLDYRLKTDFEGYPDLEESSPEIDTPSTIFISYPKPFDVSYIYSKDKNEYLRWRGSKPEIDALDGSQVSAKVLVIMKTSTRQINADYNDVDVTGEGDAVIFQNGGMQKVKWEKSVDSIYSKLKFLDAKGNEVPLVAGNKWIHIIDTYTPVLWGDNNV
ncbi:MAG: DUF3048 domain-containing protein [Candidatus Spechtbacterales bacterium]